ncbi:TraB/GumN family protein [Nitrogeniibacter mangrovi]|uniref:TraB/GumN family protein n=1 Tax=Nitrogeniibacter mangrovi TaxID=2016596 RepID=A0A6C1B670_9RHOO|nr:TraB/GumN family protein [Nitrogeniibacter mangrovi]QID18295.1 TraB/GumN family protein [Nitrogeniibacter mangrovi]
MIDLMRMKIAVERRAGRLRRWTAVCWIALAAPAWAAPALWAVSDAQGRVRGHLFGTVHLCKADCYPLPATVRAAFDSADRLIVELDAGDPAVAATVAAAGLLPAGRRLEAQLPAELFRALEGAAGRLGLDAAILQRMRPWFASAWLMASAAEQAGYSNAAGVDAVLLARSRAAGKALVTLETPERQVAALSAGGAQAQVAALRQTVEMINTGRMSAYLDRLVAAWRTGDEAALSAAMAEGLDTDEAAPLIEALLTERNGEMAARIDRLLGAPGTAFVAVGGGHLVGAEGIPARLARLGWRVRRVASP